MGGNHATKSFSRYDGRSITDGPSFVSPCLGAKPQRRPLQRRGRLKQGVTMGVFARGTTIEDACKEAARLGIKGFDLTGPADWPTLKKYGLVSSMYQPTAGPAFRMV
jgi:hypothetical protein